MQRAVLFLVFSGFLWSSCHKSNAGPAGRSGQNNSLTGSWRWIYRTDATAVFGTPYDTLTPHSTGIIEFLNLNYDSSWSVVDNGVTVNNGIYKLTTIASPGGILNNILDFVGRSGKDSLVNHVVRNDTLWISNMLYTGTYTVNIYVNGNVNASRPD